MAEDYPKWTKDQIETLMEENARLRQRIAELEHSLTVNIQENFQLTSKGEECICYGCCRDKEDCPSGHKGCYNEHNCSQCEYAHLPKCRLMESIEAYALRRSM